MRRLRRTFAILPIVGCVVALFPSAALAAQRATVPPIRQIDAITARAKDSIVAIGQLIPLSDGRVVVNDPRRKRLVILDSTLANPVVIADTSSETNKAYGAQGGSAFLYRGDTVLYVDAASEAMLVISPTGKIVRVMAFPRPNMARIFSSLVAVQGGIDPTGGFVYRPMGGTLCGDPATQDSAVIARTDIVSRLTDTLGFVRYDKCPNRPLVRDADGNTLPPTPVVRPFTLADSWLLLSDGTVAFVRALTFGIDWVDPDGARRSTPRIPHDWVHLVDSNKIAIVDSLRVFYTEHPMHQSGTMGGADRQSHRFSRDIMPILPDPMSLPDYLPAFTAGLKADADANLWIPEAPSRSIVPPVPPPAPAPGAPPAAPPMPPPPPPIVYDVVTRLGVLIDRVQLPGGTSLAGFGPGVAYLQAREGTAISLVRVRIH